MYYGYTDAITKSQVLFTDKCRDVPLNFGLRVAKTKKDKTYFYVQGGITFRFHRSFSFGEHVYGNRPGSHNRQSTASAPTSPASQVRADDRRSAAIARPKTAPARASEAR